MKDGTEDSILLELRVQGAAADPQTLSGKFFIPGTLLQRPDDQSGFMFGHCWCGNGNRRACFQDSSAQANWKIRRLDPTGFRQNYCVFNTVFQLSHVSGPGVVHQ